MAETYYDEQQRGPGLRDYLAAFLRRRGVFTLVTTLLVLLSVTVVTVLPPSYRSVAVIQIDQQEIPNDLVRTTISSYADQRLSKIHERIMTRNNITRMIDKYDLFAWDRARLPTEELLQRFASRVGFELVSGEFIDPRRGVPTQATYQFELAFSDRSPQKAFRVVNELYTLYLDENLRNRQELVSETSTFLADEARRLDASVGELEGRLSAYKEQHINELPQMLDFNWQRHDRIDAQLQSTATRIRELRDQLAVLQTRLTTVPPFDDTFSENLIDLQTRLAVSSARYSADHPSVIFLKNAIAGLEGEIGVQERSRLLSEQLRAARASLSEIRERYSDDHPDVRLLDGQVRSLVEQLEMTVEVEGFDAEPTNPDYLELAARLDLIRAELAGLQQERTELERRLRRVEGWIANTPAVERTFSDMARDYQSAVAKFSEVRSKHMEAELAEAQERDRKGEKFTLIEPPRVPEVPESPSRPLLLALGLVLSLAAGVGAVFLVEALDVRVHGVQALEDVLGVTPLGAVPVIWTEREHTRRRRRVIAAAVAGAALLPAGLVLVHVLVMPIPTVLAIVQTRYGF